MHLGGQEFLLLALLVLLLFGASRLPKLARSMREARDEFQKGTTEAESGTTPPTSQTPPAPPVDNPPTQ
jgi:sec-independent protein translocase protein TatA